MATDSALSNLSRYQALFELAGNVNAATNIAGVGQVLVRQLKFVADVFSWRYLHVDSSTTASTSAVAETSALVVDGHRAQATVQRVATGELGPVERELLGSRKVRMLEGDDLASLQPRLPAHFQKADIVQIYVCPHVASEGLDGLFLFAKRRQPFNELDVRFLTMAAHLFHEKVFLLWELEQRRALETAYLQQEIMLRESEKLATLGRLTAGMAHEINNPAAAALRNAEQLAEALQQLELALGRLGATGLTAVQHAALEPLLTSAIALAHQPEGLDPLTCTAREGDIETWLDDREVEEAWQIAPPLAAMGYDVPKLEKACQAFAQEQLSAVVTALAHVYTAHSLLAGIRSGTSRVTEVIKALKSYSYLDQAPMQRVDLHEGLNDTLVLLQNRIEDGVTVRREFVPDLPKIEAHGRELNQVWTNIIDNAIQAMGGAGDLTLRTSVEDGWVVVEIADTGSGIASDARSRIFDPFFTTRPPGAGTGLGLSISHSIVVEKHGGTIEVHSTPGDTRFRVRLPLKRDAPLQRVDGSLRRGDVS